MNNKTKITWIDTDDIMEHPDNPRKDLGDLEELTESIRAVGIMQNLTVIDREKAWSQMAKEQQSGKGTAQLQSTMSRIRTGADYIVLLGHRRLAAAREAGLKKVPCIVVEDLPLNEQISLMLVENIQRKNLKVIEEAQGFQMMLDLGDTIKTVAKMSGLSQSNVRHRVEIAKLDPELVAEKTEGNGYQLTLNDLIALEDIDDPVARNEILEDATDGDDIAWQVRQHVAEKNTKLSAEKITEVVKERTGIKLKAAPKDFRSWSAGYDHFIEERVENEPVTIDSRIAGLAEKVPEGAFIYADRGTIIVAKKEEKKEKKKTQADLKMEERDRKKKKLEELKKDMIDEWKAYLYNIISGKGKKPKEPADFFTEVYNAAAKKTVTIDDRSLVADLEGKRQKWEIHNEDMEKHSGILTGSVTARLLYELAADCRQSGVTDWEGYCDMEDGHIIQMTAGLMEKYGYKEKNGDFIGLLEGTHELYERKG